jgi:uncharacterized protein (DUF2062 family)
MVGALVGGVIGAALFAFILYTGWDRTVRRWRATGNPWQRAAQVVVGFLSNLGLLMLLAAGGAAAGTLLDSTQHNQLLLILALAGAGLFVGSFVLSFFLALFIAGAGAGTPAQSKRRPAKRNHRKRT